MILDFRIDWGNYYMYAEDRYHPTFVWDGSLSCTNGKILESYQVTYPMTWVGPGHSARETRLEKLEWKSKTKRSLAGVRFVAEVNGDTEFILTTASGTFCFTGTDIRDKKHFSFLVGPKYLGCYINITQTGYYWFRPKEEKGKVIYDAKDLGLEVHNWARMHLAWLHPEEMVTFTYEVQESGNDYTETLIHLVAMAVPKFNPEKETQVMDELTLELYCDGRFVKNFQKFYRHHDMVMQMLEDDWIRINTEPGVHKFEIKNKHPEICLGISQIKISQHGYMHGELSVPDWALKGECLVGKVFAAKEDKIKILAGDTEYQLNCKKGWNEFTFTADGIEKMSFITQKSEAIIKIYDCEEEKNPIKVGYDMTVVPHDDNGFMDWLLDYTQRTRLGNYVMFRDFKRMFGCGIWEPEWYHRWADYCRNHNTYVAACTDYLDGIWTESGGEMFSDCGAHEYSGMIYWYLPKKERASKSMKEATERFIDYMREEIDKIHKVSDCAAFGDASGGFRYSFLAGMDFVRTETMTGHTQRLISQARPAAEALGKGRWGVHIAIQHGYQPYQESHLGQYFLSLMQPWMMGAESIYEEDSLFLLFKEERQTWDDQLTKGKRDMTRSFFKFAKTHPRQGKCVRNIAFLEGRYAAPFINVTTGAGEELCEKYSVWGSFGNEAVEWQHRQPEKCWHVLDVLMPGASTVPLHQRFDKRRFYFSGTPYGDFDCVPVEAEWDYMKNYKLLLNLGWNSMIEEDYVKLKSYVESGGVLLTGLPQFSTHIKRDFLRDMEELALWNEGDLSELCGIIVKGKGEYYSGQWNCNGYYDMEMPELSSMPNENVMEDGVPYLAEVSLWGAEIVAWDAATGKPMLVKKQVGKGTVYTFTIWAYPGHEQFQTFCATWVMELARKSLPDVYVEDPSKEVFWTRWVDEEKQIVMLLNTDWTEKYNVKEVVLVADGRKQIVQVKERSAVIVEISNREIQITEHIL